MAACLNQLGQTQRSQEFARKISDENLKIKRGKKKIFSKAQKMPEGWCSFGVSAQEPVENSGANLWLASTHTKFAALITDSGIRRCEAQINFSNAV